ncbi:MAG: inositol-3-phosphate synthase [Mariniblastus sp.]|nr:inositol-3-phosphate synthase [Mariniblastus sp.]
MSRRVGLWMIGAHGGVATSVAVGLAALQRQLTESCGLVSELPIFEELNLIDWENMVVGGHDIRQTDSLSEAKKLASGMMAAIRPGLVEQCSEFLNEFNQRIRPGILLNCGPTIEQLGHESYVQEVESGRQAVQQIQADLRNFATEEQCDSVIVINLASTEPIPAELQVPQSWDEVDMLLDGTDCPLPASTLYAIAALQLGFGYVNFTPSLGSSLPALEQLAVQNQTVHAGCDGKTGETFMKSVLAPAFARRNLQIMSWVGHNIFGNMDGQVLNDPVNKKTKVDSKDQLLRQMLGYQPDTHTSIEYIRSLGDWKTAWDHVHFQGFLGTPMVLQFTWQGCDSILAAPLVLDLCRFSEMALRRGEVGTLTFLSSFFKSPIGTQENDFVEQFQLLTDWATA